MSNRFNISPSDSVKLIVKIALEEGVTDAGQIANILGQVEHETQFIYSEELNCASQAAKYNYEGGAAFCGRGYIQITHTSNYRKFGRILGQDFISNPNAVKNPEIAAKIAVLGMRDGLFRSGHNLARYMNNGNNDFFQARRIVNGFVTAQAQSVLDKSNKWLAQVPAIINGAEPDPSALPTNTGGSSFGGTVGGSINRGVFGSFGFQAGLVNGYCDTQFPKEFSVKESMTYTGCHTKIIGNAAGQPGISFPSNGMQVNGASAFSMADFNPNVPICQGCLAFPFDKPIRITAPFCQRRVSKTSGRVYYHSGTDYGAFQGEKVLAVADGVVVSPMLTGYPSGYSPGFVDIIHENLGNLLSRYGHITPSVFPGQRVTQGQVVGIIGPYHRGPHLHLELRKDKGAGASAYSIQECKTKFLDPGLFIRRN